jgi:hypothetical protein
VLRILATENLLAAPSSHAAKKQVLRLNNTGQSKQFEGKVWKPALTLSPHKLPKKAAKMDLAVAGLRPSAKTAHSLSAEP